MQETTKELIKEIRPVKYLQKQPLADGSGPLYHRLYSLVIPVCYKTALATMRMFKDDIDRFSPHSLAQFLKVSEQPTQLSEMKAGDRYQIKITGPWNGPVEVSTCEDCGFGFDTLEGHLEAGRIRFNIEEIRDDRVRFQIESMARSRDAIVDFFYDKVPVAKIAQTAMWEQVCRNFAKEALTIETGSEERAEELLPEVDIQTERFDEKNQEWTEA